MLHTHCCALSDSRLSMVFQSHDDGRDRVFPQPLLHLGRGEWFVSCFYIWEEVSLSVTSTSGKRWVFCQLLVVSDFYIWEEVSVLSVTCCQWLLHLGRGECFVSYLLSVTFTSGKRWVFCQLLVVSDFYIWEGVGGLSVTCCQCFYIWEEVSVFCQWLLHLGRGECFVSYLLSVTSTSGKRWMVCQLLVVSYFYIWEEVSSLSVTSTSGKRWVVCQLLVVSYFYIWEEVSSLSVTSTSGKRWVVCQLLVVSYFYIWEEVSSLSVTSTSGKRWVVCQLLPHLGRRSVSSVISTSGKKECFFSHFYIWEEEIVLWEE